LPVVNIDEDPKKRSEKAAKKVAEQLKELEEKITVKGKLLLYPE